MPRKYVRKAKPKTKRPMRRKKAVVSNAIKTYVRSHVPRPEIKRSIYTFKENIVDGLSPQYHFLELNNLAQGTNAYSRVGNEICTKMVHIKGVLHSNHTKPMWARMLIFKTADNNDGTTVLSELFESQNGTPQDLLTVTGLQVIYSKINKTKFTVYADRTMKLGVQNATDGSNTRFFNMWHKFGYGGMRIKYEGNTYGAGNQDKRIIFLCLVAEAADDATAGPVELSYQANHWFTDV